MGPPAESFQHSGGIFDVPWFSKNLVVDDDDRVRANDHRIAFILRDVIDFLAREPFRVLLRELSRPDRFVDIRWNHIVVDSHQLKQLPPPRRP
jgi:hypothetical protein